MADDVYLFAYGTLRPPRGGAVPEDSRYHRQIEPFIRDWRAADLRNASLYDLGTYPAARPGGRVIHGDLLHLDRAALEVIDRIEGHPIFYYRTLEVVDSDGEQIEAWVYWAPDGLEKAGILVPTGDWLERPRGDAARVPEPDLEAIMSTEKAGEDPALRAQIQRLAGAEAVWLTTVRPDGRPHSAPVWHIWQNGRIYVVAQPASVKIANIQANSAVSLTLPDPMDALIVEGRGTIVPGVRQAIRPAFQEKYGWDIATDQEYGAVIEITPYKLLSWGSLGQGRWTGLDVFTIQ